MTDELLVYQLESDVSFQPLIDITKVYQQLPHVILVEDSPEVRARIRSMKGVRCLIPSSRPKSLPQLLSQTEQMFVKGWLKRVGQQKKRVGSGLPWDAEGYEAP
jgi:hypothetical protein